MPVIRQGDGDGGGTGPAPPQQAAAARLNRLAAEDARGTVQVFARDQPDVLGVGGLKFEGSGLTSSFDAAEKRAVVTVAQVLFGTAAARPASPVTPCVYIATDTGAHSSWDGTTWRTI